MTKQLQNKATNRIPDNPPHVAWEIRLVHTMDGSEVCMVYEVD